MKKNIPYTLILFSFILLSIFGFTFFVESDGAPAGSTGSPGDISSCNDAACHGNTGVISNQTISIEVLPEGDIVQGLLYDIKVTLTGAHSRMGFQATVEKDSDNSKLGTYATSTTGAQIVDQFFATHTSSGTFTNTDTISWTFQWTPPIDFIGEATVYVAANFSNNNTTSSGDIIGFSNLPITVLENIGLAELNETLQLSILPNPSSEMLNIRFFLTEESDVKIQVVDINGRQNIDLLNKRLETGFHEFTNQIDLPTGNYLLFLTKGNEKYVEKLIIK